MNRQIKTIYSIFFLGLPIIFTCSLIVGIIVFFFPSIIDYYIEIVLGLSCICTFWMSVINQETKEELESKKIMLEKAQYDFEKNKAIKESKLESDKTSFETQKKKDIEMINNLVKEKSKGFPTLAKAFEEYFKLKDMELEKYLMHKKHPATKSAEVVKEESNRRRKAETEARIYKGKMAYLLEIFPHLEEYLDLEEEEEELQIDQDYTEEEKIDPTTWYLPRSEWSKLPSAERNDKALERYWKRKKSSIEIGKMYERYIGYLFEKEGYDVEYTGIMQGFEDLGRDLIATKEGTNREFVIQCKCWAHYKKIHVAFINQLYGTVTQYRMKNKDKDIIPMFYTTISLDDTAKEFAKYLGIEVKENFPMDNDYPCIKCNISKRTGERIYHLPIDQQYDKTVIEEEKNELYTRTAKEAEGYGFRRAYRWRDKSNQ